MLWGATVLAAAAMAAGVGVRLARGLASGALGELLRAAGLGALTAGLLLALLRGLGDASTFPDAGLALAALAGTGLLLAAGGPERRSHNIAALAFPHR